MRVRSSGATRSSRSAASGCRRRTSTRTASRGSSRARAAAVGARRHLALPPAAARAAGLAWRGRRADDRRSAVDVGARARARARGRRCVRRARPLHRRRSRPALRRPAAHGADGGDGQAVGRRSPALPAERGDRRRRRSGGDRLAGLRPSRRRRPDRRPQPPLALRDDDVRPRLARAGPGRAAAGSSARSAVRSRSTAGSIEPGRIAEGDAVELVELPAATEPPAGNDDSLLVAAVRRVTPQTRQLRPRRDGAATAKARAFSGSARCRAATAARAGVRAAPRADPRASAAQYPGAGPTPLRNGVQ